MRVLVTGGGGFIGSHLVERLLRDGCDVRVLDSFATGRRANLDAFEDVEIVEGDVQSYERVHAAVRGCQAILHQAALPSVPRSVQDPLMTNVVNVTGTLNVLLAARDCDVERVVYASSSSVYGANETLPKHEGLSTAPMSPYAVSKLAGEGYVRAFSTIYDVSCVALRYFNVFGPRQDPQSQYAAVIPRFIECALQGIAPKVFGDGEQTRDFTYIDNVVEANLLAMRSQEGSGLAFNVACGDRISLNALLAALSETLDRTVQAEHLPPRPGDVLHSHADISAARTTFGFAPIVSFEEGLRRTADHMIAERERSASATR